MRRHLRTRFIFVVLILSICGFAWGPISNAYTAPAEGTQTPDLRLLQEAWKKIQQNYVKPDAADSKTLTYAAISAMVNALGDTGHSRFLTPEMVKEQQNISRGSFEGIGAELRLDNNRVIIAAPMEGSPAERAGIKSGDVIIKVDNEDMAGAGVEKVVSRILGPAGTEVRLTLLTAGTEENVTLIREKIMIQAVSWRPLPGTRLAHLRIATFSRGIGRDLRKALAEIKEKKMTGVILDLRNNPGGLLDEAVTAVGEFVSEGNALLERDGTGHVTPIAIRKATETATLPMVILINHATASAAEILSAALKDYGRGKLVGEKTVGAGTILRTIPLSDGSALLLAFREWLTPLGRPIWHKGVDPDVELSLPAGAASVFPSAEKDMTAEGLRQSVDVQLLKAIALLDPGFSAPPRVVPTA